MASVSHHLSDHRAEDQKGGEGNALGSRESAQTSSRVTVTRATIAALLLTGIGAGIAAQYTPPEVIKDLHKKVNLFFAERNYLNKEQVVVEKPLPGFPNYVVRLVLESSIDARYIKRENGKMTDAGPEPSCTLSVMLPRSGTRRAEIVQVLGLLSGADVPTPQHFIEPSVDPAIHASLQTMLSESPVKMERATSTLGGIIQKAQRKHTLDSREQDEVMIDVLRHWSAAFEEKKSKEIATKPDLTLNQ